MALQCGIVGLPNVGKSTIFNALTAAQVDAANYPFCTIDPNTGVVAVPDERLQVLARIAKSAQIVPATVEFVDIAGLVKGASEGAGLGNQFLGHIREVDAITHVVRCFEDSDVTHVEGNISPKRDVELIDTELMLADLAAIEKRYDKAVKTAKGGEKEAVAEVQFLDFCKLHLAEGTPLRRVMTKWASQGVDFEVRKLGLLTAKPVLYVANVAEADVALEATLSASGALGELVQIAKAEGSQVAVISGKVESEISQLSDDDKRIFLSDLGLTNSGLERLAQQAYKLLDLITFFTAGPKESRAWTCDVGSTAVDAAGKIHTDFAKGFIRAEVIGYDDYVTSNGEVGARERGLLRIEGRTYIMHDGDVVHFRFNV